MAGGVNDHLVPDYKEPLYDVEELRSIAPTDLKQSLDIRSIIARIVDGSEFDEFKKLYGTVRFSYPFYSTSGHICFLVFGFCYLSLSFVMNRHL